MAGRYDYLIGPRAGALARIVGGPVSAAGDGPRLVIELPESLDQPELYVATELARSVLALPPGAPALRVEHESILETGIPVVCIHPELIPEGGLPLILFAHGFETSKEKLIRHALKLAAFGADGGCLVVLMDAPRHGERKEGGRFRELFDFGIDPWAAWGNRVQLIREYYDELIAILELYLRDDRVDPRRVGAAGISMGASVALRVAAKDTRVRAVAAFVPVLDFEHLPDLLESGFVPEGDAAEAREYDPLHFFREPPSASILVQCGAHDDVVGRLAGKRLDALLSSLLPNAGEGAFYSYREYPGLGHELSTEMVDEALKWFRLTLR